MKVWCPTCETEREVRNSLDRSPSNWTCGECGAFLVAKAKAPKAIERRPAKPAPRRGRSTKPVMRPEVREAMVRWARAGTCTVCKDPDCQPVRGHHVLEQKWLISRARTLKIDPVPLLEDPRGWLRVGERCHMAHHYTPGKRIPRPVLAEHCPDVFAMAAELGLSQRINDTYPDATASVAA